MKIIICLKIINAFRIQTHPLERRIAYITELPKITIINSHQLDQLKQLHERYPLIIIKNQNNISPKDFIEFVKQFDPNHDKKALKSPEKYPQQMLQPFDQFPDHPHVAPRGNGKIENFHGIKELDLHPSEAFIHDYVWHSDLLGHENKLPNVITGFNIITQPTIGGDTDFISGETIYENLSELEQNACKNMLLQINRQKFAKGIIKTDYSGSNRIDTNHNINAEQSGVTFTPLVYAPPIHTKSNSFQKPSILLLPSFFESVVGWNTEESAKWMETFMKTKVLPHRTSVQWKKGDLAILNNRRFMHSSTPSKNYMENKSGNQRLLLQLFIPTTSPLLAYQSQENYSYSSFNTKWIKEQEKSILATYAHTEFIKLQQKKFEHINCEPDKYVVAALPPTPLSDQCNCWL